MKTSIKRISFSLQLAVFTTLFPALANANLIDIVVTNYGTANPVEQAFIDNAVENVENQVNKNIPNADDRDQYLKGLANASSMAAAGGTVSYGVPVKNYFLSLSTSVGVDVGNNSFSDLISGNIDSEQFNGIAPQAFLTFGGNLAKLKSDSDYFMGLDIDRFRFYLSAFYLPYRGNSIDVNYLGLGATLQYQLLKEQETAAGSLKWTGIELATGLAYSKMTLDGQYEINESFEESITSPTDTIDGVYNGLALADADISVLKIPLEISTGVRLAYFLRIMTSLAADINLGSIEAKTKLSNSNFTANRNNNGIPSTITGDVIFDASGESKPELFVLRSMLGLHFDFQKASLFVNGHFGLNQNTYALNTGFNVYW